MFKKCIFLVTLFLFNGYFLSFAGGPTADFDASPFQGPAPLTVRFSDNSTPGT